MSGDRNYRNYPHRIRAIEKPLAPSVDIVADNVDIGAFDTKDLLVRVRSED